MPRQFAPALMTKPPVSASFQLGCYAADSDGGDIYRTKTYKKKRIKAYEVFKNIARDRIAKYTPDNVDDLRELRCLDDAQLELYGEDILQIIRTAKINSSGNE